MNFLLQKTLFLYQSYLGIFQAIHKSKVCNFVSFTVKNQGSQLIHHPSGFKPRLQSKDKMKFGSYLFAKSYLFGDFHNHLITPQHTHSFMSDIDLLIKVRKADIISSIIKINCKLKDGEIILRDSPLPAHSRKHYFIRHQTELPSVENLWSLMQTKFYTIPHLTKVMLFKKSQENSMILPPEIETYCSKHSIRIKLFQSNHIGQTMEYLLRNCQGNILLHQNVGGSMIYDLYKKKQNLKIVQGQAVNKINRFLMPKDIIFFAQRQNQQDEQLQNPKKKLKFDSLLVNIDLNKKNYDFMQVDIDFKETASGFLIKRLITKKELLDKKKIQEKQYV